MGWRTWTADGAQAVTGRTKAARNTPRGHGHALYLPRPRSPAADNGSGPPSKSPINSERVCAVLWTTCPKDDAPGWRDRPRPASTQVRWRGALTTLTSMTMWAVSRGLVSAVGDSGHG